VSTVAWCYATAVRQYCSIVSSGEDCVSVLLARHGRTRPPQGCCVRGACPTACSWRGATPRGYDRHDLMVASLTCHPPLKDPISSGSCVCSPTTARRRTWSCRRWRPVSTRTASSTSAPRPTCGWWWCCARPRASVQTRDHRAHQRVHTSDEARCR